MPVGEISPEVTRRTLVIKWQGQLLNKESLKTINKAQVGDAASILSTPLSCMEYALEGGGTI